MPNWKKVIISGSDAALNSLNVTTSVTASNISASGDIYTDTLIFNTGSDHSVGGGQVGWNTADGTLNIGLEDGVVLQAGQELHVRAKAQGAISNGDAVMFAGAEGDHILVSTATQAVINANPEYFVGIATHNLSNNEFGYIATFGLVRELDTDTPAWDPGTVLWFDSEGVTAGALTSTQPSAPYAQIRVAAVTRRNPAEGVILVRPDRLPKLNDLQDVQHTTPDYGDLIMYNSSSEVWENTKTLSGSYTIDNGDLNVDGSITGSDVQIDDWGSVSASLAAATLTNPITGTGTTNYVSKFTGTSTLGNSLIFDNGTNVGIGTTSPSEKLDVAGDVNVGLNTGFDTNRINFQEGFSYIESANFFGSGYISMNIGSGEIFLSSGGDVGVGTSSPSQKLHVNGNGYFSGDVGIGTTSPDEKLHVEGDIKTTNALLSNQENTDVDTGTETVAEISSTTYTAAFFDYVIKNDTNLRAGTVFACHDGSGNVEFTEISTNDLGDTSDIVLKVDISGGNIRLTATTISDNWSVKSLVRGL